MLPSGSALTCVPLVTASHTKAVPLNVAATESHHWFPVAFPDPDAHAEVTALEREGLGAAAVKGSGGNGSNGSGTEGGDGSSGGSSSSSSSSGGGGGGVGGGDGSGGGDGDGGGGGEQRPWFACDGSGKATTGWHVDMSRYAWGYIPGQQVANCHRCLCVYVSLRVTLSIHLSVSRAQVCMGTIVSL